RARRAARSRSPTARGTPTTTTNRSSYARPTAAAALVRAADAWARARARRTRGGGSMSSTPRRPPPTSRSATGALARRLRPRCGLELIGPGVRARGAAAVEVDVVPFDREADAGGGLGGQLLDAALVEREDAVARGADHVVVVRRIAEGVAVAFGPDVQAAEVAELLEHADRAVDRRAADALGRELVGDLLGGEGPAMAAHGLDHRAAPVALVVPQPHQACQDLLGHRHTPAVTLPDAASARLAARTIAG